MHIRPRNALHLLLFTGAVILAVLIVVDAGAQTQPAAGIQTAAPQGASPASSLGVYVYP